MGNHEYAVRLDWEGSTGDGVRSYIRDHIATTDPPTVPLELSADPAFRGDVERLNPEQLLLAAASSCQMLSFLGAAARAGVEVLAYRDDALTSLDLAAARLTTIRLRPEVVVGAGVDEAAVHDLAEQAHEACFVANSLAVDVEVSTTVRSGS